MASLFSTITQFKDIVGGGVNVSMEIDSIGPYFDIAHERHIEAWTGTDIYEQLITALAGTPTAAETALLPYYRKALAWLALYEYLPHASLQLSEGGLHRIETDERKTAYKYQEKKVLENCLANGYEALEKLILYLESKKTTDWAAWADAPGYENHHGVLLHTASDFRIVHNKRLNRYVFDIIRGSIEDVEAFALVPILGQDQYDGLLTARKSGSWTTEVKEKKLIYLCNRITAHLTLSFALQSNWVQFEGDRVVQREFLEDQGVPKEGAVTGQAIGTRIAAHDDVANRYVKKVRDYLTENLEDDAFADYKTYQEELAAVAEEEEAARLAALCTACQCNPCTCGCDTSERNDWGNSFGFGTGCTTRKGIHRL